MQYACLWTHRTPWERRFEKQPYLSSHTLLERGLGQKNKQQLVSLHSARHQGRLTTDDPRLCLVSVEVLAGGPSEPPGWLSFCPYGPRTTA